MQNITKMNIFCSFSEGSLGASFTRIDLNGTKLIVTIVNLTVYFCQGTMKSFKSYNFTFMCGRAAHCKTGE